MRADGIFRKLRALDVPCDKARGASEKYGDDAGIPTPTRAVQTMLNRAARRKAAEFEQRKFKLWCRSNGLPQPQPEYKFHPTRQWRFDFAFPDVEGKGGVAVEVEGGVFSRGRHVRPMGFLGDIEKYTEASVCGWRLVRVTPQTLYSDGTLRALKKLLTLTEEAA